MGEIVSKFFLERYQQPHDVFCPIAYSEWHQVLEADAGLELNESSYSIHLWNDMWRSGGLDKNAQYSEHCVYEQLKSRYLVRPATAGKPKTPAAAPVSPALNQL